MNNSKNRWLKIDSLINDSNNILLSTHINPDGDGLGSQLALTNYLKKKNKNYKIFNPSLVPNDLSYLNDNEKFNQYTQSIHGKEIKNFDLAIILDIGDFYRLGDLANELLNSEIKIISIDHHPHKKENFFDEFIHDTSVSSTGYLIYEFLNFKNELDVESGNGLYLAIMTDTGSFSYSNTDSRTHSMASHLIELGVDVNDIHKKVYQSVPYEKLKLMGEVLQNINFNLNGKLAWFIIDQDILKSSNSNIEHLGGFTDTIRSIKGVEVAIMLHEYSKYKTRINFRSKGNVKIHKLAQRFGGGGHPFASGAMINQSIKIVREAVVSATVSEINKQIYGKDVI